MTSAFDARLRDYLAQQRWFAGDGENSTVVQVHRLPWITRPGSWPYVRLEFVTVEQGGVTVDYSVPVAYYPQSRPDLGHALIGIYTDPELGELLAYDALHDKESIAILVAPFHTAGGAPEHTTGSHVRHVVTGPVDIHAEWPSVMLTGEQTNTSIVVGDDLLLKMFRKVERGRNPDIELHDVLTRSTDGVVAPLRGWIEADAEGGGAYDVAMLQEFMRTATDGWEYARNSVRNLLNEGDLYASEVGGDFAAESERLGATTAHMHQALAAAMPTATWGDEERVVLVDRLTTRLSLAVDLEPHLLPHAAAIQRVYDQLADLDTPISVQRVHGDLHLGQTLRTVEGWRLIDFEGEPAKPHEERVGLDSPLRDIAGMIRSFDYAAHSVYMATAPTSQVQHRATEWSGRNRGAFLDGYQEVSDVDQEHSALLLRAYELDKAVYEVAYEARYRPTWLPIPLAALERLAPAEEQL